MAELAFQAHPNFHCIILPFILSQSFSVDNSGFTSKLCICCNIYTYYASSKKILLPTEGYEEIKELYQTLPENYAKESRVFFDYLIVLARNGQKKALNDLDGHHLILDGLRECKTSLGSLWEEVYEKVHGEKGVLPKKYNYRSR